ncbi:MAG: hypothetical protein JNK25_10025 [Phycisphaerae bacterium]|nr:hypothetical protein [Phycisphaerae bacterium]
MCAAPAAAQSVGTVTFQGRLDEGGMAAPDGPRTLTFRFWAGLTGGTPLSSISAVVDVRGGVFTAAIPVNASDFFTSPRYVSIEVGGVELQPRRPVTAAPYSLNTRGIFVDGTGRVGIGTVSPTERFHVAGASRLEGILRLDGEVAPDGERTLAVYSTTPTSGAGPSDGFRIRLDDSSLVAGNDYFVMEKTDGNAADPDGGFAWRLTGSDNVPNNAMVLTGAGFLGIGTVTPVSPLSVETNLDGEYAVHIRNPHVRGQGLRIRASDGGGTARLIRVDDRNGGLRFEVNADGLCTTRALRILGGADLAEQFRITPRADGIVPVPGMVVAIDPGVDGALRLSDSAYDASVAGVISGAGGLAPGMVLSADGHDKTQGDTHVAMAGRVWVWCDASHGSIARGDRLTTSTTPGHAMRISGNERADGAVIGKAMTTLTEGRGLVWVLVNLQ